jgi:hypothetical protein
MSLPVAEVASLTVQLLKETGVLEDVKDWILRNRIHYYNTWLVRSGQNFSQPSTAGAAKCRS